MQYERMGEGTKLVHYEFFSWSEVAQILMDFPRIIYVVVPKFRSNPSNLLTVMKFTNRQTYEHAQRQTEAAHYPLLIRYKPPDVIPERSPFIPISAYK